MSVPAKHNVAALAALLTEGLVSTLGNTERCAVGLSMLDHDATGVGLWYPPRCVPPIILRTAGVQPIL